MMMMTLWVVYLSSFLACSTLAVRKGYAEYESSPKEYPAPPRPDWEEEDREGPWQEKDVVALSRQIFGQKSEDSSDPLLTRDDLSEEEVLQNVIKRDSPSLSIVNPLEVLRQRIMLEMARRRMKENQDQIRENAVILKNLGKRTDERTKQNEFLRRIQV